MSIITVKRELPEEFLSDILVTAFDGQYGWSWEWFVPAKDNWLTVRHSETCNWKPIDPTDSSGCNVTGCHCDDKPWVSVNVRLKRDCETGISSIDALSSGAAGFIVDHETLTTGIQRILDDDYLGIWKPATPTEKIRLLGPDRDRYADREWKWDGLTLLVETGETARGYQGQLAKIIGQREEDIDAGDIDAPFADAIVQVGLFGKAIFS